jgi:hypothetical protein
MTATLDQVAADAQQTIAELQRQLDERTAERDEALEQQTATAEILRVISSSPADLQPTFSAIAAAARTLTGAALGSVVTYDGILMHVAALAGFAPGEIEKIQELFPIPADHGTATGRAILTRQIAHIASAPRAPFGRSTGPEPGTRIRDRRRGPRPPAPTVT